MAHGIEEYLTGFYEIDASFRWIAKPFANMQPLSIFFLEYQVVLIGLLVTGVWLGRKRVWPIITISTVATLEAQHIAMAILQKSYYPGAATGVLLLVLAFALWRELIVRKIGTD